MKWTISNAAPLWLSPLVTIAIILLVNHLSPGPYLSASEKAKIRNCSEIYQKAEVSAKEADELLQSGAGADAVQKAAMSSAYSNLYFACAERSR